MLYVALAAWSKVIGTPPADGSTVRALTLTALRLGTPMEFQPVTSGTLTVVPVGLVPSPLGILIVWMAFIQYPNLMSSDVTAT